MSLGIIPLYLWDLAIFLLPGFALTSWLASRGALRPTYSLILLFLSGGAIGYAAFWIYFANKLAGKGFSFCIVGLSLYLLIRNFRKGEYAKWAFPLILTTVTGACYLSLLFFVANPFEIAQDLINWRFFTPLRPGDNVIPLLLAGRIYGHEPLAPFCCGDWLSSDRPPLQAGILLFLWPLKLFGTTGLNYQLLGSALQCSWICAVWVLLKALGASNRRVKQVLGLLIPSAFLFYNSVYVWPKLLAASFILFAVAIFFTAVTEHRALDNAEIMLGAGCIALALMSHPGSVFSLPVFGIAALVKRDLQWRGLAFGALIILCFAVPWSLYQRFVDPPGNRLLKMHLAGVMPVDSRSTWEAIRDSYKDQTWREFLFRKSNNLATLSGPDPAAVFGPLDPSMRRSAESVRTSQRDYIWNALGTLNAGWFAGGFLLIKRRASAIAGARWLLFAALINLLVWSAVMFGPGATITALCSYADILLIMIALSAFLITLPRWVPMLVIALEALNLLLVWLPFRPATPYVHVVIQWPLVFFAIASGLGLLVYAIRAFRSQET